MTIIHVLEKIKHQDRMESALLIGQTLTIPFHKMNARNVLPGMGKGVPMAVKPVTLRDKPFQSAQVPSSAASQFERPSPRAVPCEDLPDEDPAPEEPEMGALHLKKSRYPFSGIGHVTLTTRRVRFVLVKPRPTGACFGFSCAFFS